MLVITSSGESLGVLSKDIALQKAREAGEDLVLINPQADPPVAKIITWTKFKYEQSKKRKGQSTKGGEVKEMWFKPFIDDGDLLHKIERIKEFLQKGNKVKVTVRAKYDSDRGKMFAVMDRVKTELDSVAEAESDAKSEGRNLIMFVRAKKGKQNVTQNQEDKSQNS